MKPSTRNRSHPRRPVFVTGLVAATLILFAGALSTATAATRTFPNVPLVNQDGETLHFYDDVIKGKVVTINFMFTSCPDSCPMETAKLREVQKLLGEHLGKNVFMYSISVDPERDTPAALKAYMEKFNVGPGWQFLTGKQEDVQLIRDKLGMLNDDEQELSDHSINFIMGNEETGRWVKRTPFDVPESLVAALLGRLQKRSLLATMQLPSYAQSRKHAASIRGEDLFLTRCTACHTIGQGDKAGPDLLDVVSRREPTWLSRWLKEPDVMLKENDPLATSLFERYNRVPMPNLQLGDRDVRDLLAFIETVSKRVAVSRNDKLPAIEAVVDHSQHMH